MNFALNQARLVEAVTPGRLEQENQSCRSRGGVSAEARSTGFTPAFMDFESGAVYASRFADGRPAPIHLYDGLPAELVVQRNSRGRAIAVRATVICGFLRDGRFHTREEASRVVNANAAGRTSDRQQAIRAGDYLANA